MRAVTICVNMAHILRRTLPYNLHHFEEGIWVVTSHGDKDTQKVCESSFAKPVSATEGFDVHCFRTNAFTQRGHFNKFLALEEGIRKATKNYTWEGFLCLMDCDILWPKVVYHNLFRDDRLTGMDVRRILEDENSPIPAESHWRYLPLDPTNSQDGASPHSEVIGYTQVFHTEDYHLGPPPWHQLDLPNCAKGDSLFQQKWPLKDKVWLPYEVLHVGPTDGRYWDGRKGEKT